VSRHPLRARAQHKGMTLLACSLVLLGVAMLASASLRSIQDDVSLTYSTVDRLLAQQAAEAALQDAAATLSMIPENLTIVQAQGSHHLGEITGERFAKGGPMQSCSAPEYFLEILPKASGIDPIQAEASFPHRYRVTAKGKGLSEATVVVLRAEFETQTCAVEKIGMAKDVQRDIQNVPQNVPQNAPQNAPQTGLQSGLQSGVQYSMQKEEQASHQLEKECIPQVRRLAWRMLYAS
jgi:Tfp pilus assembly protein PilX